MIRTRRLPVLIIASFLALEVYWIGIKKYDSKGIDPFEHNQLVPLRPGRPVGQLFLAEEDNLCRLRVLLVVPEEARGTPVELNLQGVGREGREHARIVSAVREDGWLDVRIQPIPDSKERGYHFFLVAREGRAPPVHAAISADDPYAEGKAYGQGVPTGSDLRFEFFYAQTIIQKLDTMTAGKPFIFGSKAFLAAVFVCYSLALGLFFLRVLFKSRGHDDSRDRRAPDSAGGILSRRHAPSSFSVENTGSEPRKMVRFALMPGAWLFS